LLDSRCSFIDYREVQSVAHPDPGRSNSKNELQNAERGGLATGRPDFVLGSGFPYLPNPLAPAGSIESRQHLFIDQSGWMGECGCKDANALHRVRQNPETQRKRAAR
jgi:hypothetical protein